MFDSNNFFKQRFSAHLKELSRYLRYIFNGHLMIAMLFFISALAFYYQRWLTMLPENFPVALIIGAGLGLLVSYSPVRTLLKEPDLFFLIAAENKMNAYFRNALIYSFVIQLYVILLVAAAFGPLYFAAFPERTGEVYLWTLLVVLVFKVWNLLANWWMLRIRDAGVRRLDLTARTLMNIAVFYFLVRGEVFFAGVATLLFIGVFLYDYSQAKKQPGIAWDLLVEKDQNRMHAFYRFASMFSEVPHLKSRVKKRQWLVSLVSNMPFAAARSYDYLYRITFIRSGDYLGMYLRLVVIGGLFIYFIPNLWISLLFAILFLYLSCFQMMALYHHHRTIIWLDLYPLEQKLRQRSLVTLLFQLTFAQAVLFALVFLVSGEFAGGLLALTGGVLFTYLFINGYVKKKIA
ncbi:ABC transporter permease [Lentibacillus sediminis]|uniref:ABC transporter permease n=1 Tax=Lentibacillus sediminis TaxID=1940529 RepID=UPI000C1C00C6|nr:ABC transporter permease [Lentibacillus sediminis]